MQKRFYSAMATYAIIAVLAFFTLDGGMLRNVVWIAMVGFAAKTYIAYKADQQP
jgi:hypothetical protein